MQGEPSASPPSNAPEKNSTYTFDEFLLHLLDRSKSKTPSLDNDKTRLPPARLSAPAHLKFTPLLCSNLVRRYFGKTVLPLAKSTLILQQQKKDELHSRISVDAVDCLTGKTHCIVEE